MDLGIIFLTGLTLGGLTCLAVQGGLLASVITAREEQLIHQHSKLSRIWPTAVFLLAKLLVYIGLGFTLGSFGERINLSAQAQSLMQLLAGVYMIAVAMNLLNIHPIFRYVIPQPPRFLFRLVKNQSRSKDLFAPFFLGLMTVFIPCGTTIAMEALAISSASPWQGAAVMGAFTLGTFPLFFGVGYLTSLFGDVFKSRFLKVAAVLLIYLGVTSVNGSLVSLGSPITLGTIAQAFPIELAAGSEEPANAPLSSRIENGSQLVDLTVTSSGYAPNYFRVQKGLPVKLNLRSVNAYSCALAFRIPAYRIVKNLQPNDQAIVEFIPQKVGKIAFSCSMGMYTGIIEVI